jgi:hypothetical protein
VRGDVPDISTSHDGARMDGAAERAGPYAAPAARLAAVAAGAGGATSSAATGAAAL